MHCSTAYDDETLGLQRILKRLMKKAADERLKLLLEISRSTSRSLEATARMLNVCPRNTKQGVQAIRRLQEGQLWTGDIRHLSARETLSAAWQTAQPLLPIWGEHRCRIVAGSGASVTDPVHLYCATCLFLLLCKNRLPDGGDIEFAARALADELCLEFLVAGPRIQPLDWPGLDFDTVKTLLLAPQTSLRELTVEDSRADVEPSEADDYVPVRNRLTITLPLGDPLTIGT